MTVTSDRGRMTNLWMDPAVDPASERPVAAAAGLWTAEAKHGRAEVLTQWGKNLMQWKKINGVEIKIIAEMSLPLNVHTCPRRSYFLVAPTRARYLDSRIYALRDKMNHL